MATQMHPATKEEVSAYPRACRASVRLAEALTAIPAVPGYGPLPYASQMPGPGMVQQPYYDYNAYPTAPPAQPAPPVPSAPPSQAAPSNSTTTTPYRPTKRQRTLTEEEQAAITRNFTRGDFFVGVSAPVRIDPRLTVRLTLGEGDQ
jgi:hypothetical protein